VRTTDFSTLCCKKPTRAAGWQALMAMLVLACIVFFAKPSLAAGGADINNLRVEQAADGLYLSASLRFELPPAVEDALQKGIALSFVAEANLYRDRWYWYDKAVLTTTRTMRLSYVPLTRRWRLNLGAANGAGLAGAGLAQNFDSLYDALAAVSRFARWKIAEGADLEPDSRHSIDFRFRLDTSQLPRPLQFGVTGNSEWQIAAARNVRPEPMR
jgi:hypothetical protein